MSVGRVPSHFGDAFAAQLARFANHCRPFPSEEVTSRNVDAEVHPHEVGLTHGDVDAIWGACTTLYQTGLHPALSLTLRRRGKVVIDRAIGHLRGNGPEDGPETPKVPVRHDSLFTLYSASKVVTAMLVHQLVERGKLGLDDRVAQYIPEYACAGKEDTTIRQVLTHRAGVPTVQGVEADLDRLLDWPYVIAQLCKAPALTKPGSRLAYHALTGGYILAEVLRRVTGKELRTLVAEEIRTPLGFRDFDYGLARERAHEVAVNAFTGAPPFPPFAWVLKRSLGVDVRDAVKISNDPRFLSCVIPSGNIVCTANEACRFFELLRCEGELAHEGKRVRVFAPETVRSAVARTTSILEIDSFLGIPVRYGMGFMLGSPMMGLYGAQTPRAYGHIGFTNVVAWADPEREISACLMTSGKPFITPGQVVWLNVAYTISRRIAR